MKYEYSPSTESFLISYPVASPSYRMARQIVLTFMFLYPFDI